MLYRLLPGCLFLFYSFALWGQSIPSNTAELFISATYEEAPFAAVIQDLESRYPLQFFYDPTWGDSLYLSAAPDSLPLQVFLNRLFEDTDLFAYASPDRRILITKGVAIVPMRYPPFFVPLADNGEKTDMSLFTALSTTSDDDDLNAIENRLIPIGDPKKRNQGSSATLAGYLTDAKTGEALIGASVFTKEPVKGTLTDDFGYYTLSLPKGEYEVFFRHTGRSETKRRILLHSDGRLDVEMQEKIVSLTEVQITSERSQVDDVQTGVARLSLDAIKTTPTVLGEADVMKLVLTLPGVQTVGEGASGFNVRGGSADQNLITIDDGIIYNPSHLFGFFSAFNADVIKSAELYKSGLQAQHGGRVSSIFEVALREGNRKRFSASGGISPLTSKLTIEGPIKRDTSSFILGLRSTYSNWLLGLLDNATLNNSNARFSDVIGKVNHRASAKGTISLSLYHSRDQFSLNADTLFRYQNTNGTLRYRHLFNNALSGLFSLSYTQYAYQIASEGTPTNSFALDYDIQQFTAKAHFDYVARPGHQFKFGVQSSQYRLNPGELLPTRPETLFDPIQLNREIGQETALYFGDEWEINPRLSVYGGLRLSVYNLFGPNQVFTYADNLPREPEFITDTVSYGAGSLIQTYVGPELRLSGRYKLNSELAFKFSYDRTYQYIHMLTNTVSISPTDTWRLSNPYLKPQIGDQVAMGLYQNLPDAGLEISLEGYGKLLNNLLEYKDGADLLVNEVLETDVVAANGLNYGLEFLFKKKSGKLTGWASYTWSRAWVQTQSPFPAEQINEGAYYPSNFDQPHKFVLISNYKFSRRINFSFNLTYNTGRPTTLPITRYQIVGAVIPFFTARNQYRIPDYFRMDVGINIEGNHKVNKLVHSSASFSVYNATGRNNAYSVFSRVEGSAIKTYQLSIFSQAIPTFTYTFSFR